MRFLILILSLFLFGCGEFSFDNVLSLNSNNQLTITTPSPEFIVLPGIITPIEGTCSPGAVLNIQGPGMVGAISSTCNA